MTYFNSIFRLFLKPEHEIGQPAPLIKEIKPEEIQNLKERFAGRSKPSSSAPVAPAAKDSQASLQKLENEVSAQGDIVRGLKESKAEKDAIKAAVDKLLDLKKQLALAQGKDPKEVIGNNKKGKKK